MRLLYTASDGRLSWTDDLIGDQIPPYAILSHTWDGQEVAYKDLKNHKDIEDVDAKLKGGYQKLFFCAQQSKRDGLGHFWVDTCCIDKSNSQELQEAINSMFRWYQNAKKCYVYLSDIQSNILDGDGESALRRSKWFTRGWTLQELLAPNSVEFFSKEGVRLGDKKSLEHIIHDVTGIPVDALAGSDLFEFNVAERFSWAEKRQTTREEDGAYCLLGIFGIYMSLIYGEGKDNAIKRLQKKVKEASEDIAGAFLCNIKTRSQSQEERLSKICNWLSAPDPSTNYHKAHKQRQAETGLWLLESAKFTEWKDNAASRLWLYGIPGCGKTILSSTIIEHLLQHCNADIITVTAYFYFDFNDIQKQNPELMLRSLLCQLLQRSSMIPKGVDALFSSCENGRRQPSVHTLLELTPQVIQQFTHVYVILDALDECKQRPELMDMLETVAGWQLDNVHLLITSRKERDIESSLEIYVKEEDTICLQRDVVDKDIKRYVQQRLSDDKHLAKWNKDATVRQEIEAALMRGACGMFRWAACQLDALGKCRSRAMLRKALATLPPTLDQTYDRILCAISEADSKYALRTLQWLTFSARPLSLEEVAEAVAIDVTRDPAFDRDDIIEDPLEILIICSGLVTLTTDNERDTSRSPRRIIALAHYSVQEYLVSDRIRQGQAKAYSMQAIVCHDAIAKASLQYLLQFQHPLSQQVLDVSALARYSAEFWSSHLWKTGDEKEEAGHLAMTILSVENPAYLAWIQLCDPDIPWKAPDLEKGLESVAMPLYYAAQSKLDTITTLLLDDGADVNAPGGLYGNALTAASAKGHKETVTLLLDRGAEVNAQGGWLDNALRAASFKAQKETVMLLLDKGAEVNAQGRHHGNALCEASIGPHWDWPMLAEYKEIILILLDRGANVNALTEQGDSALCLASMAGNKDAVMLLLDRGAKVNVQGTFFGSALQSASLKGHRDIAMLLLDKGAEVNAQGGHWGNALQAASSGGDKEIVMLLLDKGAEVNAPGGHDGSALQAASSEGHKEIVMLLLDRGAEINAQGGDHGSALQAASYKGHKEIVMLLLDRGAKTNAQSGYHGNVLQAASFGGHKDLVKLLISRLDTTLQFQDRYGRTLLWWAAAGGDIATVETLIRQYNFNPREPDNFGRTPFWIATKKGHDAASKLLWEECEEAGTERPVPLKVDNNQRDPLCDVCTSRITVTAFHYHCCLCAGGDWDMCEDCKASGASCAETAHTLVKRTMRNEQWVQVPS